MACTSCLYSSCCNSFRCQFVHFWYFVREVYPYNTQKQHTSLGQNSERFSREQAAARSTKPVVLVVLDQSRRDFSIDAYFSVCTLPVLEKFRFNNTTFVLLIEGVCYLIVSCHAAYTVYGAIHDNSGFPQPSTRIMSSDMYEIK